MKRLRLFIPNNPLFIDKNGVIFYEGVAIYDTHWHLSCCIRKNHCARWCSKIQTDPWRNKLCVLTSPGPTVRNNGPVSRERGFAGSDEAEEISTKSKGQKAERSDRI
jgi:hypothetical protein